MLHEGQWSCSTKLLHKKDISAELKWFSQVNQNSKSYLTISLVTTISIVIIGFGAIFGCYFFGICEKWNLKFRLTQCCRGAFGNCKLPDFLKRNTSESDEPAYYVTKDFSFQNEPTPNSSRHQEIKFIRNTNSICANNVETAVEITDYVAPKDDCTEEIPAEYDYITI